MPKKTSLQSAVGQLMTIALKHLDKLSPSEREERIKALEKRVSKIRRSEAYAIRQKPAQTQESRLSARGRAE